AGRPGSRARRRARGWGAMCRRVRPGGAPVVPASERAGHGESNVGADRRDPLAVDPRDPLAGDPLVAEIAAMSPPGPPPLSAELEAELARLGPVAPRRPVRQLAILVAVSLIYASGLVAALALRPDLGELPRAWIAGVAAAWLLGFVAPSYLALVPRRGAVVPRGPLAAIAAVAASIGFVALGRAIHPAGPSSGHHGWAALGHGHGCLEIGLGAALVPVALGALWLRRALPVGSRWIAAALGAGGGSLGGLVLHLHCRIADGPHVGVVHGGVVVVAALISAAIVPRAIAVR
ncbi:MAG: NrsF family protein, partial [Kofleriaceae bacterium]